MIANDYKWELTNKVLESRFFSKSTTSSALLRYLVQSHIEGKHLKEDTINIEFYGNDIDEVDTSNTRVRVSIYNLRKKLDNYYQGEGKDHDWVINIRKGQYDLDFKKNRKIIGIRLANNKMLLPYSILLLLSLYLASIIIPPRKPDLWYQLLTNDKPITLCIGDAFGMLGKTPTGTHGWNRDYSINSLQEFTLMLQKKPNLRSEVRPAHYTFTTAMAAHSSHYLTRLFTDFNADFHIRLLSKITYEELSESNFIYVGPYFVGANKLVSLFNDYNPYIQITRDNITINNSKELADTSFNISGQGLKNEYVIVSRMPGPKNTEQFLFFGNHDYGVTAAIEYFTNPKLLKQFKQNHLGENRYFTAIFEAHGMQRTNIGLKELGIIVY